MKTSLKEELFKFTRQKTPVYGLLTLLVLMSYSALTAPITPTQLIFEFGAVQWVTIIMIAVSSAFLAMEYRQHTIILLVAKHPRRFQVYLAKLLVLWLYSLVLTGLATVFTVVLKTIFVGHRYGWFHPVAHHQTLFALLSGNVLGTLLYTLFIVALSLLLITLVKSNAIVIGIGLALGFMGAGFSVAFMHTFAAQVALIRWNPLNMIFITQQLANPPYAAISHLGNGQVISGTLLYTVAFILVGYWLFKKRPV